MAESTFNSDRPRRWLRRLILGVVLLAVLLGALWTWFSLSWSYSEGERAGILQKFSRKGWICKTYEGELALYVVGGVAPQIWHFSTRDEELAKRLAANVGRSIRLHYSEHRGIPTTCFAETPYFAESFTLVSDQER
ncbi:hypothetical protein JM946_03810 [Steroidobacter sp. S1-65]|uniref:Uncharacterized protein n=1 Tax=Steroidobacter gossypii TaxID=2805490 RepID=A0ABS1WSB3_9GAMM|nr:hypothetical protein [Steroidobacter gossypii]MBM0103851.1 hypothetical protein [Steroidobacter gossypii]